MNPLASLLTLFVSMKADLATRFNAALVNRPPLESVEGSNVALSVLREMDWAKERLERLGTELNATLSAAASIIPGFEFQHGEPVEIAATRLIEKMKDETAAKAISTAIAAKTHLPMEDHQTALDNAVTSAKEVLKTELENGFTARLDEVRLIAERRSAVIEKLGVIAAAALTDTDLAAEDHEARLTRIEGRVGQLAAAAITPEAKPKSFASLMACGTDEAGETEFTARLETIKEASGNVSLSASAPKPSTLAGTIPSGSTETRKKLVI